MQCEARVRLKPLGLWTPKEREMVTGTAGITPWLAFHPGMGGTTEGPVQILLTVVTRGSPLLGPRGPAYNG